jgi:hypothetical protein
LKITPKMVITMTKPSVRSNHKAVSTIPTMSAALARPAPPSPEVLIWPRARIANTIPSGGTMIAAMIAMIARVLVLVAAPAAGTPAEGADAGATLAAAAGVAAAGVAAAAVAAVSAAGFAVAGFFAADAAPDVVAAGLAAVDLAAVDLAAVVFAAVVFAAAGFFAAGAVAAVVLAAVVFSAGFLAVTGVVLASSGSEAPGVSVVMVNRISSGRPSSL